MTEKKVALIVYSDTDFGGAERRLIRIYNELGKKHKCDIVVRGSKREDFVQRLKKADCDVSNINKIIFFENNIKCLVYLILHKKYSTVHYLDVCGFNQKIASIMNLLKVNTLLTVAYQNYAYGIIDIETRAKLSKLINTSYKVDVLFPEGKKFFPTISSNCNITVTPGTFTQIDLFLPGKKDKILLFAAARLEKDKNAELLIEASYRCASVLRKEGYKVVICGKDFEEQYLRNKIHNYCIDDIVKMPGYVKISEVFPNVELFFCLDLIDNYPSQTIAEAVSCGCAIICTDVGYSRMCGTSDFIKFVRNDASDLSRAIELYITKSDKQKDAIVRAARKYALENYSIKTSADYFERLLWK